MGHTKGSNELVKLRNSMSVAKTRFLFVSRFPVLPPDFVARIVDAYYPVDVR